MATRILKWSLKTKNSVTKGRLHTQAVLSFHMQETVKASRRHSHHRAVGEMWRSHFLERKKICSQTGYPANTKAL